MGGKRRRNYNRFHQDSSGSKTASEESKKDEKEIWKMFGPFSVHSISNKNLCSSVSKGATQIETKDIFFFGFR